MLFLRPAISLSAAMRRVVASSTLLSVPLISRWTYRTDGGREVNSLSHEQHQTTYSKMMQMSAIQSMTKIYKSAGVCQGNRSCIFDSFFTFCDIEEIVTMEAVQTSINGNTLVIYDVDNTIFEPVGNFGSDQWFFYLNKVYQMDGFSPEEAEEKALELWNRTQYTIKVRPVERNIPNLIKQQQSKGVKVIAMTARTGEVAAITMKQLQSINVNFSQSSLLDDGIIEIKKSDNVKLRNDVLFENGILFVGEKNSKGEVLLLLLESLKYSPQNVVFIDDRMKHLIGVEKALGTLNIPYKGFRYGGADENVRAFDKFTSEILDKKTAEVFYMGKLL